MICLIVLHDPVALPTWIGSFLYKNTHSINPRQSIKPNSINYNCASAILPLRNEAHDFKITTWLITISHFIIHVR